VDIITVPEIDPVVRGWNLGQGESEVLSLGRQENIGVVLDDLQARKCANVLEILLIGTLGLVVKAKHMGFISQVKPVFDRIIRSGLYIEPEMLKNLLRKFDEEYK
jgi:predicted nucleic acid-binding protein